MLYSRQIGQLQEGTDQTLCQEDRHLCGKSWACGWIRAEEPRDKGTRIEVMLLWYRSGLIKSGPLSTLFRRLFFSGSTNNFIEQITQQLSQTEEYPPQTISQMLKAQSLHSKELKKKIHFYVEIRLYTNNIMDWTIYKLSHFKYSYYGCSLLSGPIPRAPVLFS